MTLCRPPKTKDIEAAGEHAQATYSNRFGSWAETLEAAHESSLSGSFLAER